MTDTTPVSFSEVVMLYCRNWEIIHALEVRWKSETDQLVDHTRGRVAPLLEGWEFLISNTYGWARKQSWAKDGQPNIAYQFWWDPSRIGQDKIGVSIQVKDRELRNNICKDENFRSQVRQVFGQEISPRNENLSFSNTNIPKARDNYEDAIVELIERCIEFAPNLDRFIS